MFRLPNAFLLTLLICHLGSPVAPAASGQDDAWIPLFDGQTLNGWTANENPGSWTVQQGALVARGERSHLFFTGPFAGQDYASFKNFEFSAEVMTKPGANSGIYVHTHFQDSGWPAAGYELQVINSNPPADEHGGYIERKMTGSIYAVRNTWKSPVSDNQWFTYRIMVSGKTIRTWINDQLICEYTEPEAPYRPGDKSGRVLGTGTFALQAHDPGSEVHYKNLKVRLLPDTAGSLGEPLQDMELDQLITQLSNANLPLIDLGIVTSDSAKSQEVSTAARRYGLTLGSQFFIEQPFQINDSVVVFRDDDVPVSVEQLQLAQQRGQKIAFTSGGATAIDPEHLKQRLRTMQAAELNWQDLWVPAF